MSYSSMKRSLEIELISGEGLKVNQKPVKRKTYCVVRIDDKRQQSNLDEVGGNNPVWKDKISMEIALNARNVKFISIEVFYRSSGGQDKSVGFTKIPVTDFIGGFAPPQGHLSFLSYRLRDEYGDKCGIVNVSIMVKPDGNDVKSLAVAPVVTPTCSYQAAAASNGQMWRQRPRTSMGGYGGRVVTGVPVWCAYHQQSS